MKKKARISGIVKSSGRDMYTFSIDTVTDIDAQKLKKVMGEVLQMMGYATTNETAYYDEKE